MNPGRPIQRFKPIARIVHSTRPVLCNVHIAEKAIADCRHGCDVARLADVIPQQTPQKRNAVTADKRLAQDAIAALFVGKPADAATARAS
jgi:hypothetical protein